MHKEKVTKFMNKLDFLLTPSIIYKEMYHISIINLLLHKHTALLHFSKKNT